MKRKTINELIRVLYPDDIKCILCGKEMTPRRYGLCPDCKLSLNENYCNRCGRHKVGIGDYCSECGEMHLAFDEARSSVNYDASAKDIVLRLKYGSAKYLAAPITEYLLDTLLLSGWDYDCLTFVPMHRKREKSRGYNQARLLAESLSERLTVPCIPLLEKTIATPNQAKLSKEDRMKNLKGSFSAITRVPSHIVLIDDVMTTGSTLNECASVLKKSGATVVYGLTFASVPERPLVDKAIMNIKDFRR